MVEERLQRALARAGYGSRRSSEELIAQGKVRVNGRIATLGDKVDGTRDEVTLAGTRINLDPEARYLVLNKPSGVLTTMRDQRGRADIRPFLPKDGLRVFPVGRLDRDSEGLLLLTNDGELANHLSHPRYGVEKEYLAEVAATPTAKLLASARAGVMLDDGPARARSVRLVDARHGRGQVAVVMTEGRKREVRRLLAAVGLPVTRLVRVRIGPIRLGRLKPGERRELTAEELLELQRAAAEGKRRAARAVDDGPRPPAPGM